MLDFFTTSNAGATIYLYSVPFFLFLILFEMYYSYKHNLELYTPKDFLTNVVFAITNYGLDLLIKVVAMGVMYFFYSHRIFNLQFTVWYWLGVFLLQDFAYYVHHLVDHSSRLFWAVHVTHHNSEKFNITTGFRSPVFQPFYRYLFFSPLAFIGFNPLHIMTAYAVFQIHGTWIHTKTIKSLGFLEWFLVTPSHHRVHHACNDRYLDRNMGMGLIIWDRIFGTFEKEDPNYEPIKFGITTKVNYENPTNILLHEWNDIWKDVFQPNIKFSERLKYLFYPPGWNHYGNGKTSKNVREEERLRRESTQLKA